MRTVPFSVISILCLCAPASAPRRGNETCTVIVPWSSGQRSAMSLRDATCGRPGSRYSSVAHMDLLDEQDCEYLELAEQDHTDTPY